MPYVEQAIRKNLIESRVAATAGDLNFLITSDLKNFWERSPKNYAAINTIIGALESAKIEFYRRIAVPYEEAKIKIHGDVY